MQITQLRLHTITKKFQHDQSIEILHPISATFCKNHSYAITGVSGAGKSTLLYILAGLDNPTSGTVYFDTHDSTQLPHANKQKLINSSLGLVFQIPYLIAELSIIENVMIKGLIAGMHHDECKQRALDLLCSMGLNNKAYAYPAMLSGGQQQRVAIARALINKPDFLIADEPTAELDEYTAQGILELLLAYKQEWSMGLIISSHDPKVVASMETIFHVYNGNLIEQSNPNFIYTEGPRTRVKKNFNTK